MEPGKHLILDFYGCDSELLNNYEQLKDLFEESLSVCNATVLKITGNKFEPQGVTLLALLAESHASLHSWPEYNYCAMDYYTCGNAARPGNSRTFISETRSKCSFDKKLGTLFKIVYI